MQPSTITVALSDPNTGTFICYGAVDYTDLYPTFPPSAEGGDEVAFRIRVSGEIIFWSTDVIISFDAP